MSFFQNTCKPEGIGGKLMVQMMNSGHAQLAEWGISHMTMSKKDTRNILDIGCGGGANVANWLKLYSHAHVTGIDYSDVSVESSRNKNKEAIKQNRCDILLANVLHIPCATHTFDMISAFETIYFWPEIEKAFAEVYRVLKVGGQFIICNEADGKNPKDEKWTKMIDGMRIYEEDKLCELLSNVGFSQLRVEHSEKHWMCVIAEKK